MLWQRSWQSSPDSEQQIKCKNANEVNMQYLGAECQSLAIDGIIQLDAHKTRYTHRHTTDRFIQHLKASSLPIDSRDSPIKIYIRVGLSTEVHT